jgi:hypothetical protein
MAVKGIIAGRAGPWCDERARERESERERERASERARERARKKERERERESERERERNNGDTQRHKVKIVHKEAWRRAMLQSRHGAVQRYRVKILHKWGVHPVVTCVGDIGYVLA